MPNINIKTYVDVHTTGEKREFSSLREYDKFLKSHHAYVVNKEDAKRLATPKPYKKIDERELRDLAQRSWAERGKYIPEIKKRIYEARKERKGGIDG